MMTSAKLISAKTAAAAAQTKTLATLALAAFGVALGLAAEPAAAQQALRQLEFKETLLPAAPRAGVPMTHSGSIGSGSFLVALSLGAASNTAPVDLARLRVALSESGPGDRLCLEIQTHDQRYYGQAAFQAVGAFAKPPTLGLRSRHAGVLRDEYKGVHLLVVAKRGPDCDAGGGEKVYAPAVIRGGASALVAQVSVGGRARVSAWLSREPKQTDDGRMTPSKKCVRKEHRALSHICALPITGLQPGRYALNVKVSRISGDSPTRSFMVVLP